MGRKTIEMADGVGALVIAFTVLLASTRVTAQANVADGVDGILASLSSDDVPQNVWELYNTWGPYKASVSVMSMPGLPGNNYIHYPADIGQNRDADLPLSTAKSVWPVVAYSWGFRASCIHKPSTGGSEHALFMAYLASWGPDFQQGVIEDTDPPPGFGTIRLARIITGEAPTN